MLMELSVTKVIISATVASEIYIGARYVSVCHKSPYLMMMILIMMTMIMMIMMLMDSLRNLHINSWRVKNKYGKSVANEAQQGDHWHQHSLILKSGHGHGHGWQACCQQGLAGSPLASAYPDFKGGV